jgi:hypothetical protein
MVAIACRKCNTARQEMRTKRTTSNRPVIAVKLPQIANLIYGLETVTFR